MLRAEYQRNPNWSKNRIKELAARLNLNRTKVYKWNWDQRNKMREQLSEDLDEEDESSSPEEEEEGK